MYTFFILQADLWEKNITQESIWLERRIQKKCALCHFRYTARHGPQQARGELRGEQAVSAACLRRGQHGGFIPHAKDLAEAVHPLPDCSATCIALGDKAGVHVTASGQLSLKQILRLPEHRLHLKCRGPWPAVGSLLDAPQ